MGTWNVCTEELTHFFTKSISHMGRDYSGGSTDLILKDGSTSLKMCENMVLKLVAEFARGPLESLYHQQHPPVQATPAGTVYTKGKWLHFGKGILLGISCS